MWCSGMKRCGRTMFVRCAAWTWNPSNGSWPTTRYLNQGTGCGSNTYPEKTSQVMRNELGPRWSTCSSTSRNRVTHLFCNVNRVEKGTVTLDEEQGEVHSVGRAVRRSMFGVQNIVAKMAVEESIRSSRAPEPRSTVGPCLSNSFGEILRITRRQSQLESTGCSNPSDDMDPR